MRQSKKKKKVVANQKRRHKIVRKIRAIEGKIDYTKGDVPVGSHYWYVVLSQLKLKDLIYVNELQKIRPTSLMGQKVFGEALETVLLEKAIGLESES